MILQQRCPVCEGNGLVSGAFYYSVSGYGSSTNTTEKCKNCDGTGIVHVDQGLTYEEPNHEE